MDTKNLDLDQDPVYVVRFGFEPRAQGQVRNRNMYRNGGSNLLRRNIFCCLFFFCSWLRLRRISFRAFWRRRCGCFCFRVLVQGIGLCSLSGVYFVRFEVLLLGGPLRISRLFHQGLKNIRIHLLQHVHTLVKFVNTGADILLVLLQVSVFFGQLLVVQQTLVVQFGHVKFFLRLKICLFLPVCHLRSVHRNATKTVSTQMGNARPKQMKREEAGVVQL